MKKILMLCTMALFAISTSTYAQKDTRNDKGLLWEISGKGLSTPSYLYGTIHMICKEDFRFSATLKDKFTNARNVYLEIDMDDPGMMMRTASLMILKDKSLKDLMSAEDYTFLSKYVQDSLGMPMMVFNKMKPMALLSLLSTRSLPCSASESYEQTMVRMAQQQKKDIRGLETLEDQIGVFDKIPDSLEVQMILEMMRKMPDQKAQFNSMVKAYKDEDINALAEQMNDSPEIKGFEELLLANRNRNWIPVMEKAMKEGNTLFAVGAGHLPGKDGVIELLRKAGYTVKPVQQMYGELALSGH